MWNYILDSLFFKDGILIGVLYWIALLLSVFALFLIGAVIVEICYDIYVKINTNEIVEENVVATVIEKDYAEGYTSLVSAGKCLVPVCHSDTYDVYLEYEGREFILDDEDLYDRVKENDKLPAKLIKYLSKDGKVLKIDIEVEKDS